ncbi:hypothetical protein C7974DRAFT_56057 [Boeremia exigua]|uniref:uncharacterized protein n=1 Tax=Boeremia exigua TaxID=749465 RepID=UPI001E8DC20B|nr:uncharacterized protein C7974DRAFT_56057 [Boeremia exigua]KAH6614919.1 hypothetical protein C7974DRAFT_56057 [Boeremia exigua]
MFVSVKERARQIANGQFTASTTSGLDASLTHPAPEPKLAPVTASKKSGRLGAQVDAIVPPSKTKPSTKVAPPVEPTVKVASPKTAFTPAVVTKAVPPKPAPPTASSSPKKGSTKPKVRKDSPSKPLSPKIGSSKPASASKAASQVKSSSTSKIASPTKFTTPKTAPTTPKNKRSKSPPKRVDSPIEDNDDPLASLKSTCLKQVSGVTGLGGRRLAIVLKQRSSGEWYAALKDLSSDKYLKMWMNKDKTFATKEEALEGYLVFVTKTRNEVRWFPMSPRASSPKGLGK